MFNFSQTFFSRTLSIHKKNKMNNLNDLRPWVPEDTEIFIQQHVAQYQEMSFDELELKAFGLIEAHENLWISKVSFFMPARM